MRFSTISAALAVVASAVAQTPTFNPITKPASGEVVPAGSTYTIMWQSTVTGTVAISIIGGEDPKTLVPKGTIATGVDSSAGQYAWTVDPTLGKDKTYGIVLTLESNTTVFQYSMPFQIKSSGGGGSGSSNSTMISYSATSAATSYVTSSNPASSTPIYTTPIGNLSTTLSPTSARSTSTPIGSVSTTSSSRPTTTSSVPNAAGRHVAGSLALVGGIAAAVFAL